MTDTLQLLASLQSLEDSLQTLRDDYNTQVKELRQSSNSQNVDDSQLAIMQNKTKSMETTLQTVEKQVQDLGIDVDKLQISQEIDENTDFEAQFESSMTEFENLAPSLSTELTQVLKQARGSKFWRWTAVILPLIAIMIMTIFLMQENSGVFSFLIIIVPLLVAAIAAWMRPKASGWKAISTTAVNGLIALAMVGLGALFLFIELSGSSRYRSWLDIGIFFFGLVLPGFLMIFIHLRKLPPFIAIEDNTSLEERRQQQGTRLRFSIGLPITSSILILITLFFLTTSADRDGSNITELLISIGWYITPTVIAIVGMVFRPKTSGWIAAITRFVYVLASTWAILISVAFFFILLFEGSDEITNGLVRGFATLLALGAIIASFGMATYGFGQLPYPKDKLADDEEEVPTISGEIL